MVVPDRDVDDDGRDLAAISWRGSKVRRYLYSYGPVELEGLEGLIILRK